MVSAKAADDPRVSRQESAAGLLNEPIVAYACAQ